MSVAGRAQVLRLYRALLRESQRFGAYNYRTYAIRRIRDAFRENKNIKDSEKIEELVNKAKANLEVIRRQPCFIWRWQDDTAVPACLMNFSDKNTSLLQCVESLPVSVQACERDDPLFTTLSLLRVVFTAYYCELIRLHDTLRCQKTDSLLSYDILIFSILVRLRILVDPIMASQVTIGQLYSTQKLVIESPGNT